MKLLGIQIKMPTHREMYLCGCLVLVYVLVSYGLFALGLETTRTNFLFGISGFLIGVILSAFGVSVVKNGWRGFVIYLFFVCLAYGAFLLFGG